MSNMQNSNTEAKESEEDYEWEVIYEDNCDKTIREKCCCIADFSDCDSTFFVLKEKGKRLQKITKRLI